MQEMQQWVLSGIPVNAVLASATSRVADFLAKPNIGRVKPGASADLLLLEKDPEEEIRALLSPEKTVIVRGRRVNGRRSKKP
ncbi:amidohydrolase family protein [Melghirimyces algeriensis]|uniref:amidohydrolase family protein n=1 Tax=Melghirimyces algeriensis TaxID=910412 RepID=UPI00163D4919|nr:amidohydrolase family protein [Melghirimyces algeriensis]